MAKDPCNWPQIAGTNGFDVVYAYKTLSTMEGRKVWIPLRVIYVICNWLVLICASSKAQYTMLCMQKKEDDYVICNWLVLIWSRIQGKSLAKVSLSMIPLSHPNHYVQIQ